MYFQYGDCIILHEFTSLFGRRSSNGTYFPIIFIVGQSKNLEPLIFGICFLNEGLVKHYKKMLQMFFLHMKKRIPLCIVTDGSLLITRAIELLKLCSGLKFQHFVNWFHVIENLKKKTSENIRGASDQRLPASNVENYIDREKGAISVKKVR